MEMGNGLHNTYLQYNQGRYLSNRILKLLGALAERISTSLKGHTTAFCIQYLHPKDKQYETWCGGYH